MVIDNYEVVWEKVWWFLNVGFVDEIVFIKFMIEVINLVFYGLGGNYFFEGDEIVLFIMEYYFNIVLWYFYCEWYGVKIKWVYVCEDGLFDLDFFCEMLMDCIKLVVIIYMLNVFGIVVLVKEVCEIVYEWDILVLVDGSQVVVYMYVDVQDIGCDYYVFIGYKVYGLFGIGVFWGKLEWFDVLWLFQGGGEMIFDVIEDNVIYNYLLYCFEVGILLIVQVIGLGVVFDYMDVIGCDNIVWYEVDLKDYVYWKFCEINFLRIFGEVLGKGVIVFFEIEGVYVYDVLMIIDWLGVVVCVGIYCVQLFLV